MSGFLQYGTVASEAAPGVSERDALTTQPGRSGTGAEITLHCWREREEHQHSQGCNNRTGSASSACAPLTALGTRCSVRAVVAKMALDQIFWTPIALVMFFACFALLEGRSTAYLRAQLRAKFLPTLVKGFALWPAAHLINFRYVPNPMRILYVNMIQVRFNFLTFTIPVKVLMPQPTGAPRRQ